VSPTHAPHFPARPTLRAPHHPAPLPPFTQHVPLKHLARVLGVTSLTGPSQILFGGCSRRVAKSTQSTQQGEGLLVCAATPQQPPILQVPTHAPALPTLHRQPFIAHPSFPPFIACRPARGAQLRAPPCCALHACPLGFWRHPGPNPHPNCAPPSPAHLLPAPVRRPGRGAQLRAHHVCVPGPHQGCCVRRHGGAQLQVAPPGAVTLISHVCFVCFHCSFFFSLRPC